MPEVQIILRLISRFFHVIAAILMLGGFFYSRYVLTPILNALPEDKRLPAAAGAQLRFRTALFSLVGLSLLSGIYNLLQVTHGKVYHIAFGIKMLGVLHIYAVSILWATSNYGDVDVAGKPKRRLLGLVIAGFIVVFISAYLRSLTQRGL